MIRRPPRSTPFPTRRSSDLLPVFAESSDFRERVAGTGEQFFRGRGVEGHAQLKAGRDRKSTRLNSSHLVISYAVFCLKKKKKHSPVTELAPYYSDIHHA